MLSRWQKNKIGQFQFLIKKVSLLEAEKIPSWKQNVNLNLRPIDHETLWGNGTPLIVTSLIYVSRNNNNNNKNACSSTKHGIFKIICSCTQKNIRKLYIIKVRWHLLLLNLDYYENNIYHIIACCIWYAKLGTSNSFLLFYKWKSTEWRGDLCKCSISCTRGTRVSLNWVVLTVEFDTFW